MSSIAARRSIKRSLVPCAEALVATLLDLFGRTDANSVLETGFGVLTGQLISEQVGGEKLRK